MIYTYYGHSSSVGMVSFHATVKSDNLILTTKKEREKISLLQKEDGFCLSDPTEDTEQLFHPVSVK